MKKFILVVLLVLTTSLCFSQGYEFRTSIYPKTSHSANLGDATHYWSTAYLDSMYGYVKFQNYPYLFRGAVLGQDGTFDGILRFDKINHQRGYLGSNPLTGYRNWKFPDTSGTVAMLDSVWSITKHTVDSALTQPYSLREVIESHTATLAIYDTAITSRITTWQYNAFGDTLHTWASGINMLAGSLSLYALRDDIISEINLFPDSAKINSAHLFIDAPTVFRAINGDTNSTSINGGKLKTGTVTADSVSATFLTATRINALGITATSVDVDWLNAQTITASAIDSWNGMDRIGITSGVLTIAGEYGSTTIRQGWNYDLSVSSTITAPAFIADGTDVMAAIGSKANAFTGYSGTHIFLTDSDPLTVTITNGVITSVVAP